MPEEAKIVILWNISLPPGLPKTGMEIMGRADGKSR